jgi:GNAT superfamily N-acetyltransferase
MSDTTIHSALPAGITLREASPSDIPGMIAVVNAAFEEESFFVNAPRTHQAQIEEHFRRGHFLLAHQDARLTASVYYELRGQRGYIGMLAVCPGHQRRGLGRGMVNAAEGMLRSLGCKIAELSVVNLRTALLAAYRNLGYREAGTEELPEELRRKITMPIGLIKMEKQLQPQGISLGIPPAE